MLRSNALMALQEPNPAQKVAQVEQLRASATSTTNVTTNFHALTDHDRSITLPEPAHLPGRPAQPALMAHLQIPKRSLATPQGLATLIHAVCHIEFNAINLALDAIWRFPGMPEKYYADWLRVAFEEAHHFSLLRALLQSIGFDYGDFPAHNGLWDMVERTKGDIVARMALVPRTLEARGLDATPPMQAKLRKIGTPEALRTVEILGIILRDEVGHVAIGNHWYRWLCEREALDPIAHFRMLCAKHAAPRLRPPLNEEARKLAGFTDQELTELLQ
jgi:uncharacterized ferritin-like protein (DUF455 family)